MNNPNEMFEDEVLETEIVEKIEKETDSLVVLAQKMMVETPEGFQGAAEFLKGIKGMMSRVEDEFDENIKKAHSTWKGLLAQKNKYLDPLKDAETLIKRKMGDFNNEQERKVREEQAKIDLQARKDRETLERKAKEAEAKGNTEKAEELRLRAATAPVPVVEKAVPIVSGVRTSKTWKCTLEKPELVENQWKIIDTKAVEAFVKATKGQTPVPGFRIYEDTIVSGSGK